MIEDNNLPLVSICCVTYNHAPYIRQCLDGFLMQKSVSYEVLIHDDASTDETANIIREYEHKYPNIIKPIYQIENQYSKGISPSITFNFPRAKGKYIALCEGDDYWTDPYKLQKQVDFLENNPDYCVVGHNAIRLDNETKKCTLFNQMLLKEDYTIEDIIIKDWFIPTASILFNKQDLDNNLFNRGFANGDYALQLNLLISGKKLYYSNEILSIYRRHTGGLSNTFSSPILIRNLFELLDFVDGITDQKYHHLIEDKKSRMTSNYQNEIKLQKKQNSLPYKIVVAASNFCHKIFKI